MDQGFFMIWGRQMALIGHGMVRVLCVALVGLLVTRVGAAERPDTLDNALVMELLKKIEQRDVAIRDLQRRVAEFERQQGMAASEGPAVAAMPVPKVTPAVPSEAAPAPAVAAPPTAPGQFEVDEEAAVRALERTLVQTGVLLLPRGMMEVEPSLAYTRWELDVQSLIDLAPILPAPFIGDKYIRRNVFDANLALRFGLPYDSQVEVAIPYRWVDEEEIVNVGGLFPGDTETSRESGFGDIRLGIAKTLVQEERWWPDLVGRVVWDTDTGATNDAVDVVLGDGFNSVSLVLSALKRQDPLAFIGDLSYRKTFEKNDREPGDQFGLSLGAVLAASPETSLRFVFNQTVLNETKIGGREVVGSDLVLGNLTLGVSTNVGRGSLLDVSTDIGVTDAAPDYTLRLSFNKRFGLW
jgi:hypothetical protein